MAIPGEVDDAIGFFRLEGLSVCGLVEMIGTLQSVSAGKCPTYWDAMLELFETKK